MALLLLIPSSRLNSSSLSFVDFLKFETDDNLLQDAFIFHYKNASNTLPWMKGDIGVQYNQIKTQALQNLLNQFQFQKRILGE
jgi:hypothetical protein